MRWSLSEFLNFLEIRGQSWCVLDMGAASAISIAHSERILVHAVLQGSVKLYSTLSAPLELNAGDVVILTSGVAHAVRTVGATRTEPLDLLNQTIYSDAPQHIAIGDGPAHARMLSGKMRVRWPGGAIPARMPPLLRIQAKSLGIDLEAACGAAEGAGGTALLTMLASVLFTGAFREEPRCRALARWNMEDPVVRAQLLIQKYPCEPWTVETLASKVGMGRSNFAAHFRAQIGMTPIDALAQERMLAADRLLRESDLKVAEISERVGYRSEAAFIRRFTAQFGTTPGLRRREGWAEDGEGISELSGSLG